MEADLGMKDQLVSPDSGFLIGSFPLATLFSKGNKVSLIGRVHM